MSPKVKPWLLVCGIFVIGVVTGSALTIGVGSRFLHPPQGAHSMKANWMDRLTKRLNLTPGQQAKIQPILADADTKFQALLHDERQHGSQIFKDADDQIEAILTPDQQVELKKMEAEREKMFPGHMHAGHGGQDAHEPPKPEPPPPTDNPAPPPVPPAK
jgi:Spy/CpxP family protein refolding chaperone